MEILLSLFYFQNYSPSSKNNNKVFLSQSTGYTEEWALRDHLEIIVLLKFMDLPHKLHTPVDEKALNEAIKLDILCNLA